MRGNFRYIGLADTLESKIRNGIFRAGDKLPSIRRLHADTALSISTVYHACIELEKRGLVHAKPKSGYYVKPLLNDILPPPAPGKANAQPLRVTVNNLARTLTSAMGDVDILQLGGALVAPELLPAKALASEIKSLPASRLGGMLAAYENPQGSKTLRRQIAQRMLVPSRCTWPDEVIVTNGCIEAVAMSLQAVAAPGDLILVESPTFPWFLQIIEDLHMYAIEVPTDCQTGIHLNALSRILEQHPVKACVFMSNFQNPSGYTMSDSRKKRLVEMVGARGLPIIEDDIYGDLYYGDTRPRPLKAFDTKGNVLYCASFSKTLSPGLRVGWVAAGRHLEAVRRIKLNQSIASPGANQHIVARFLSSGRFDRHLRKLRTALKNQIANSALAVARHFPAGTKISAPMGGLTLWVQLPAQVDSLALFRQALAHKVAILPGVICSTSDSYRNCIRISCGMPWGAKHDRGFRTLGRLITQMASG